MTKQDLPLRGSLDPEGWVRNKALKTGGLDGNYGPPEISDGVPTLICERSLVGRHDVSGLVADDAVVACNGNAGRSIIGQAAKATCSKGRSI
jgi:hypothetical protein